MSTPLETMRPTAVVIDDSATSRRMLSQMLTEAGFEVVAEGERGDQAISLYERHRPTLMTLDIVLPVMDGVTAARLLTSRFADASVVMCSSISARDKILACRAAGVAHFILKPFNAEKIREVADKVRQRSTAAPAHQVAV